MQIRDIHIDGFGMFSDTDITGLKPGLNILYGPNEAGKTTLLEFIRRVLFGFPTRRERVNRYEPVRGGRLKCESASGEVVVVSRVPGAAGGRVTVSTASRELQDQAALQPLLGQASENIFQNIFAFSLDELQDFGTLQGEEIKNRIYGAGMGLGAVDLGKVEKDFKSHCEEIFKPRGWNQPIPNLWKKIQNADQEISKIQKALTEHADLKSALERVIRMKSEMETRIQTLTDRMVDLKSRMQWADHLEQQAAVSSKDRAGFGWLKWLAWTLVVLGAAGGVTGGLMGDWILLVFALIVLVAGVVLLFTRKRKSVQVEEDIQTPDPAEQLRQKETLSAQLEELVEKRDRAAQAIADARSRMNQLSNNDDLLTQQVERENLKQEINSLAGEWAVHRIALALLDIARKKYEKERQPAVIQSAGRVFREITGEKYTEVVKPLDEEDIRIKRPDGIQIGTAAMSRGTREQLYLSMRFGLIEEYERQFEPLPVVMDDVFVNFDDDRVRRAREFLARFAQNRQVLVLTCHRRSLEAYKALGAHEVNLPTL